MWSIKEGTQGDTREWRSGRDIFSGRRPVRPKSACSSRNGRKSDVRTRRCRSALGLVRRDEYRHQREETPTNESSAIKKQPVTSYRRCLKLLGLEQQDSSAFRRALPNTNVIINIRSGIRGSQIPTGRLEASNTTDSGQCHRLQDIRGSREVLAKAVYEEWYFNKLEKGRSEKRMQILEQKAGRWREQNMKLEQCEKSKEKVAEWIQRKNQQRRIEKQIKNLSRNKPGRSLERSELSFVTWKKEKDKITRSRVDLEKIQQEERERRQQRREDAEKAYQAWKKRVDEALREKQQKELKIRKDETERIKYEAEEKQRSATASFRCWKVNKDREYQKRLREARERMNKVAANREEFCRNRLMMSEEAFLNWLDAKLATL